MSSPVKDAKNKIQAQWPGATIHGRGKGWIRHQHPIDQNRFAFDSQIGNRFHFGIGPFTDAHEIDTDWGASTGAWDYEVTKNDFHSFVRDSVPVSYRYLDVATQEEVELTITGVEWVNDENDNEDAATFSQQTPSINGDMLTWVDIATGWNVSIQAQPGRLAKLLTIDSLTNLGSPTIGGTNERLQINLTLSKSSGLEIWLDGVQWDEKNNTQIETSGDIEFRNSADSNPIFWFVHPSVLEDTDEDSEGQITQRIRKTGNNLFVELSISWVWLQNATYPIEIDPSLDYQVGASSDDAKQIGTVMDITGTEIATDDDDEWGGYRWTGVTIPSGATIDVATVDLVIKNANMDEPNVDWWGEDTSTPATFTTTSNDISSRTPTTATILWDVANLGMTTNAWLSSNSQEVDVKSIIAELQASYDYSSGLALVLFYEANGPANRDLVTRTYDNSTAQAGKLHIEYSTGAAASNPPRLRPLRMIRR